MFQDKVVIITGSGAGIGRETAIAFAQKGAKVVVNSVSMSGQGVCDEIRNLGLSCTFVQADVSVAEGAKKLVGDTVSAYDGIDVLINNAGIVPQGSILQTDEEQWDQAMAVNVKSVYLMSKYAMPYLEKSKGVIVNTTSAAAIKGVANRAAYSATKGAVLSLSRAMAVEHAPAGVRVNCVCPGTVDSPSLQARINVGENPAQALQALEARQVVGRLGRAEEIAQAMIFAAAPNVSFMTGANIVVDGGMTL